MIEVCVFQVTPWFTVPQRRSWPLPAAMSSCPAASTSPPETTSRQWSGPRTAWSQTSSSCTGTAARRTRWRIRPSSTGRASSPKNWKTETSHWGSPMCSCLTLGNTNAWGCGVTLPATLQHCSWLSVRPVSFIHCSAFHKYNISWGKWI